MTMSADKKCTMKQNGLFGTTRSGRLLSAVVLLLLMSVVNGQTCQCDALMVSWNGCYNNQSPICTSYTGKTSYC
jgi:hypothetical protein